MTHCHLAGARNLESHLLISALLASRSTTKHPHFCGGLPIHCAGQREAALPAPGAISVMAFGAVESKSTSRDAAAAS